MVLLQLLVGQPHQILHLKGCTSTRLMCPMALLVLWAGSFVNLSSYSMYWVDIAFIDQQIIIIFLDLQQHQNTTTSSIFHRMLLLYKEQKHMKIQKGSLLLTFLLITGHCATYTIGTCNSSQYFSTVAVSCVACDTTNKKNLTPQGNRCICKAGSIPANSSVNWNQSCTVNATCTGSLPVYQDTDNDGSYLSQIVCVSCADNYTANSNNTKCQWCGPNSVSSNGSPCTCLTGYTPGTFGCYNLNNFTNLNVSSTYRTYVPRAAYGCFQNSDILSCSFLMNLCAFTQVDLSNGSICSALNSRGYMFLTNNSYSATATLNSADTNKVYNLDFKLVRFFPNGSVLDDKSLNLVDLTNCQIQTPISTFKIGNNLYKTCEFNFNNILNLMQSSKHNSYLYSLFVADENKQYYQVPVYVNGKTEAVMRFFLEDTFSVPITSKLTVATSISLEFTLTSKTQTLFNPKLSVTYKELSISSSTLALSDPVQTVTVSVSYGYDLSDYNTALLAIFITVNVVVLIHVTFKTYVAYKNRKSIFLFFQYLMQSWSTYMFFLLLLVSGYWFIFTKAATQLNSLMPKADSFYAQFYVILGLAILFRLITDIAEKMDTIKSEVYLIDWDNSPGKNSWRSMFIVNSLAEFYNYRTVSFFWALAWTVFLLVGTQWEKHTSETTELKLENLSTLNPTNPVLMYFLCSSIMLVVGSIMKFARRLVVIWWPYPFEDFLDYCSLANISIFFCKRNAPIGFYLYATNPEKSNFTFKQINDAVSKGSLRKRRDFLSDPIAQSDDCQTFLVYLQSDFQTKLTQLRRTEDMIQLEPLSYSKSQSSKKLPQNIREQFTENYLKRLLMSVPQQRNQLIQPTFLQSCIGLPPVNLTEHRELPTFIPSKDYQNLDFFPNSNEFHDLITFILLFCLFSVITQSSATGAFISYLIYEVIYQAWIGRMSRANIERFTKVKSGFML